MATSIYMIVAPGTHISPSPEYATLYEDPQHQTPACTAITAIGNATAFHGTYNAAACTAVMFFTVLQYTNLLDMLLAGTVRIDFTYDETVVGNTKPIIGIPTFSPVSLQMYQSPIVHIAQSISALEQRFSTGVSAELREDIRFIKAGIEQLLARP
jgi:hypothetical protein